MMRVVDQILRQKLPGRYKGGRVRAFTSVKVKAMELGKETDKSSSF